MAAIHYLSLRLQEAWPAEPELQERLIAAVRRIQASGGPCRIIACEAEICEFVRKHFGNCLALRDLFLDEERDSSAYEGTIALVKKLEEIVFGGLEFLGQPLRELGLLDRVFRFHAVHQAFQAVAATPEGTSIILISKDLVFPPISIQGRRATSTTIGRMGDAAVTGAMARLLLTGRGAAGLLAPLRTALSRSAESEPRLSRLLRGRDGAWRRALLGVYGALSAVRFLLFPRAVPCRVADGGPVWLSGDPRRRKSGFQVLLVPSNTASGMYYEPIPDLCAAIADAGGDSVIVLEDPALRDLLPADIQAAVASLQPCISAAAHSRLRRDLRATRRNILRALSSGEAVVGPLERCLLTQYYLLLEQFIGPLYRMIDQYAAIFSEVRPDSAVLLPDRTLHGQTPIGFCKSIQASTVTYPMGFLRKHACYSWFDADHIFVSCMKNRSALIANGLQADRIRVVGDVRYDRILRGDRASQRRHFLEETGIPEGVPVLALAVHLCYQDSAAWVRELLRLISSENRRGLEFALFISPHPSETPQQYEALMPETAAGIYLRPGMPLATAAAACDAMITDASHAGNLAVLMEKPILVVNFSDRPYCVRFDEDGVAVLARSSEEILPALRRVMHDEPTRRRLAEGRASAVRELFCATDGRSAARFVAALRSIDILQAPDKGEREPAAGSRL